MRRWVTARRRRKGGNARQGGSTVASVAAVSRCCRAVLALAGLSGPFAYIVPTRPQSPISLYPCKLLILMEPASGLEPRTC